MQHKYCSRFLTPWGENTSLKPERFSRCGWDKETHSGSWSCGEFQAQTAEVIKHVTNRTVFVLLFPSLFKSVTALPWTSAASPWKASPSSTFPACTAAPTFGAKARRGGATAREGRRVKTKGRRWSTPKNSRLQFKVVLTPVMMQWVFSHTSCTRISLTQLLAWLLERKLACVILSIVSN